MAKNKIGFTLEECKFLKDNLSGDYKVIIFGSRINGNFRKYSDLDVCLVASQNIPLAELAELKEVFEESSLLFKVDLLDYHDLAANFQEKIKATGIELNELYSLLSNTD